MSECCLNIVTTLVLLKSLFSSLFRCVTLVFLYDVFHWFIFRFHLLYFVAFRQLLVKD